MEYRCNCTIKEEDFLPKYGTKSSAGLDLYANKSITIFMNSTAIISTGFKVSLPENTVGLIKLRSSIFSKHLVVCDGVIDSDYRGEIKVMLHNNDTRLPFFIEKGDRIAQLVCIPIVKLKLNVLKNDKEFFRYEKTERGKKGFGSTGK